MAKENHNKYWTKGELLNGIPNVNPNNVSIVQLKAWLFRVTYKYQSGGKAVLLPSPSYNKETMGD
jgi:hypothetical protein